MTFKSFKGEGHKQSFILNVSFQLPLLGKRVRAKSCSVRGLEGTEALARVAQLVRALTHRPAGWLQI